MTHIAHALVILGQLAIVALVVWVWVKYVWAGVEDFWDALVPTFLLALVLLYFCPTPEALSLTRV